MEEALHFLSRVLRSTANSSTQLPLHTENEICSSVQTILQRIPSHYVAFENPSVLSQYFLILFTIHQRFGPLSHEIKKTCEQGYSHCISVAFSAIEGTSVFMSSTPSESLSPTRWDWVACVEAALSKNLIPKEVMDAVLVERCLVLLLSLNDNNAESIHHYLDFCETVSLPESLHTLIQGLQTFILNATDVPLRNDILDHIGWLLKIVHGKQAHYPNAIRFEGLVHVFPHEW
eukprot:PhF_6_TR10112/c0_g1_i1/m.15726